MSLKINFQHLHFNFFREKFGTISDEKVNGFSGHIDPNKKKQ